MKGFLEDDSDGTGRLYEIMNVGATDVEKKYDRGLD
jgi:hypothetical protein